MSGDFLVYGISAVAAILASVQIAKEAFNLPGRYAPILALAVGVVLGAIKTYADGGLHPDYVQGAFSGTIAAVAAMGLYSGVAKWAQPKSDAQAIASMVGIAAPLLTAAATPTADQSPTAASVAGSDSIPAPTSPVAS